MVSDLAMQAWKTNFVKLFPWPFRALPPPKQAAAHENMKIRLCMFTYLTMIFN
jgi:hypothetical protein